VILRPTCLFDIYNTIRPQYTRSTSKGPRRRLITPQRTSSLANCPFSSFQRPIINPPESTAKPTNPVTIQPVPQVHWLLTLAAALGLPDPLPPPPATALLSTPPPPLPVNATCLLVLLEVGVGRLLKLVASAGVGKLSVSLKSKKLSYAASESVS